MLVSLDDVNRAQITRTLQVSMPFFTGYEAFILDNLIGALDKGDKGTVSFVHQLLAQNRPNLNPHALSPNPNPNTNLLPNSKP